MPKSPLEVKSIDCTQDRWRRLYAEDDPMESISADLSTILDRILDPAADNLRIAKILVQIGLDPNNIT